MIVMSLVRLGSALLTHFVPAPVCPFLSSHMKRGLRQHGKGRRCSFELISALDEICSDLGVPLGIFRSSNELTA